MLSSLRQCSDKKLAIGAGALVFAAALAEYATQDADRKSSFATKHIAYCSQQQQPPASTDNNNNNNTNAPAKPNWLRYYLSTILPLPIPRVPFQHDPDLTLPALYRRQRQRDEQTVRSLHAQLSNLQSTPNTNKKERHEQLALELYATLYGPGVTPADRQAFLERYGCTGYTEEVLAELLHVAHGRGFVEIGAGQGQWARALTDRYQQTQQQTTKQDYYEYVLAYDNQSALPLRPDLYHQLTQPHHDYFYDNVRTCDSIPTVLQQWQCRGRVLLLIYPGPDDMAVHALTTYADITQRNDTVAYVGEGRGGANANDAFFDALESGDWILMKVLQVQVFGTKGYERLYLFQRRDQKHRIDAGIAVQLASNVTTERATAAVGTAASELKHERTTHV
jgi:hypothetical protein